MTRRTTLIIVTVAAAGIDVRDTRGQEVKEEDTNNRGYGAQPTRAQGRRHH